MNIEAVEMKFKKVLIAIAALITIAAVGIYSVNSVSTVQAAKVKKAPFPKNMQGTWYTYDKYFKKIVKRTFTKNKEISYDDKGKKTYNYLYAKPAVLPETSEKTKNWRYFSKKLKISGYTWIGVNRWGFRDGGTQLYYNVAKLKKNWVLGLAFAQGEIFEVAAHWYRSPKLAKKLKNMHYPKYDFSFVSNDLEH